MQKKKAACLSLRSDLHPDRRGPTEREQLSLPHQLRTRTQRAAVSPDSERAGVDEDEDEDEDANTNTNSNTNNTNDSGKQ